MKKSSIVVLLLALTIVAVGWKATPTLAQTLTNLASGALITNTSSANALSISQKTDVGKSRSASGALHIDNTGNRNTGLTLYTNNGAATQPLMRLEVDNPNWNEEILYIRSDSPTSRGLIRLDSPSPEIEFVETDQKGATGKFEIRVQHGKFQFNSRRADDTTFENKMSMTQSGDLELVSGAVKVKSDQVSEFAGGINITGGCLAIDGKCLSGDALSGGGATSQPASSPQPSATYASIELSDGVPPSVDCNSYTERGRMVLDHKNNRLYVCNGPERGWDYSSLNN